MTPTEKLKEKKDKVLEIVNKYEQFGFTDLKIHGSVARGEDTENSDLDLVYTFKPIKEFKYTYFSQFNDDLEDLLGIKIDLSMDKELKPLIANHILSYAVPFKFFLGNLNG
ncbi:MAG: nucleotidyltransferase domain-containing protein [Deltaproteobacteria bacterium]|jgi:predicted nucleotidyltransferase|nr:nucleotidyltransferase domain-containing protein [Deltaproteobacteria bacterium]